MYKNCFYYEKYKITSLFYQDRKVPRERQKQTAENEERFRQKSELVGLECNGKRTNIHQQNSLAAQKVAQLLCGPVIFFLSKNENHHLGYCFLHFYYCFLHFSLH